MARLCGLCPCAWSALGPPRLTQMTGGAEPGAWRGTRRGPRHPSSGSPVFRRSSPGILFSSVSTVIPWEETGDSLGYKQKQTPKPLGERVWVWMVLQLAYGWCSTWHAEQSEGDTHPIREEEKCRVKAMMWSPDGGSTGGKSLLRDRPLRDSPSVFPSPVQTPSGVHLFLLLQIGD